MPIQGRPVSALGPGSVYKVLAMLEYYGNRVGYENADGSILRPVECGSVLISSAQTDDEDHRQSSRGKVSP